MKIIDINLRKVALVGTLLFTMPIEAYAISLNGEYSINVTTTQIDADSWIFQYDVTNNNQQLSSALTGFDGLFIQVPSSATISNVVLPPPYYGDPGLWDYSISSDTVVGNAPEAPLTNGYVWLGFWGYNWDSVYPIGTTATLGFQADGVDVGTNQGVAVTFWNTLTPSWPTTSMNSGSGKYTAFSSNLIGPIATPIPAAIWLFCIGLLGLIGIARSKKAV